MIKISDLAFRWFIPALGAVAVAGFSLYWKWPAPSPAPETKTNTAVTAPSSSADVVDLQAGRDGDRIDIVLSAKRRWHINANPASLDFLISTEIRVLKNDAAVPTPLVYPPGHAIDVGLDKPIQVYSGRSLVTARLPGQVDSDQLKVVARVQACNDSGRCLRPSTLETQVGVANRSNAN